MPELVVRVRRVRGGGLELRRLREVVEPVLARRQDVAEAAVVVVSRTARPGPRRPPATRARTAPTTAATLPMHRNTGGQPTHPSASRAPVPSTRTRRISGQLCRPETARSATPSGDYAASAAVHPSGRRAAAPGPRRASGAVCSAAWSALAAAEPLDVPRVELAQVPRGALGARGARPRSSITQSSSSRISSRLGSSTRAARAPARTATGCPSEPRASSTPGRAGLLERRAHRLSASAARRRRAPAPAAPRPASRTSS